MGTITQDHTAAGPVLDPTYRRVRAQPLPLCSAQPTLTHALTHVASPPSQISKAFDAAGARGMLLSNLVRPASPPFNPSGSHSPPSLDHRKPVRDGCAVTLDAGPAEHGADGAYPGQGGSAPRSPSARGRRRSSLAAATTPGARSPADAFASVYRGPGPGEEEGQGGDMQIDVTDLRAVLADIGANVDRLTLCPALDGACLDRANARTRAHCCLLHPDSPPLHALPLAPVAPRHVQGGRQRGRGRVDP